MISQIYSATLAPESREELCWITDDCEQGTRDIVISPTLPEMIQLTMMMMILMFIMIMRTMMTAMMAMKKTMFTVMRSPVVSTLKQKHFEKATKNAIFSLFNFLDLPQDNQDFAT